MEANAPADVACVCTTARMASRVLTRLYDDALRPLDLRTTQFSILSRLEDEGPSTISRLGQRLALERTTVTRDLVRLEERGLVTVERGDDRRQRVVSLREAGRALLARAWPAWQTAQERVRAGAGDALVARALDDLRSLARVSGG